MMNLNLSAKNYVSENGISGNMTFSRVVRITSKTLVGAVFALVCILLAGALCSRTYVWAKSEQYTLNDKGIGSYSDVDYIRVDGIDGGYIGFDRNTGYITWINEDVTEAVIPSEIDGVSVKGIADWVAQDREGLKKVIIPEGIEAVGQGAFRGSYIKEITFPSSMKSLGNYSLGGCPVLKSVIFKGNSKGYTIGKYALRDCPALLKIEFGKGLKSLGEGFGSRDELLESVTVGGQEIDYLHQFGEVDVEVGDYAFRNCYFIRKDFSPSYKTGKWYDALHKLKLNAGKTGDYVSDMFKIAYSQKGYHEGDSFDEQHGNNKRGDNDYAEYNYWWGEPGTKWCGEFAAWVIAMASVPEEIYSTKYDTPEEDTYKWEDTSYAGGKYSLKKGDVILFKYDGGNHVIMVESVSVKNGRVTINSIDGNHSDSVENDVYEINAKTGKTTNCWTDINGYVDEVYGPDWSKYKDIKFYTVKFNACGGKTKVKSKKLSNGAFYGVLPIPTREGYEFDGWYTKKEGGTKITAYRKVQLTKKTTLYAHWKKAGK